MAEIIREITLNIAKQTEFCLLEIPQGDFIDRMFYIKLINDSDDYIIPSTALVTFSMSRVGAEPIFNECPVTTDGKIKFTITPAISALDGRHPITFTINDSVSGGSTSTFTSAMKVEKSVNISSFLVTTGEYTALDNALQRVGDVGAQAEACKTATANAIIAKDAANAAADLANEKAVLADTKASLADTATTNAINATSEMEVLSTDIINAENIRISDEGIRKDKETARESNESIRQDFYNAYKVCETYNNTKSYIIGNKVTYDGSTYQCILNCTGIQPTNTTNWMLIAAKGADGTGGNMMTNVYDPTGKATDMFNYVDTKLASKVAKGELCINVRDYGAIGDWNGTTGTDNVLSVQSAIEYAKSIGGGIINFTNGIFRFTNKLLVDSPNISFTGSNATLYLDFIINEPLIHIKDTNNININNLKLNSNPLFERGAFNSFILVDNSNNVIINNNIIENSPCASIYSANNSGYLTISNNIIKDGKADGIHLTDGTHDCVVSGNTIDGVGDDGISNVQYPTAINSPCDNLITGNTIRNVGGSGISSWHGKRITAVGNLIENVAKHGMIIYNWETRTNFSEDCVFESNTIRNSDLNGIIVNYATRTNIQNNVIETTGQQGILIGQFDTLKIKGNTIRNSGATGIITDGSIDLPIATNLFIDNNIIDTTVNIAINISVKETTTISNVYITDNKIYNNDTSNSSIAFIFAQRTNGLRVINNYLFNGTDNIITDSASCINVIMENNYPHAWLTYTPVVTASTGTITSYTSSGWYERKGNTCFVTIEIATTDIGDSSVSLLATLPVDGKRGTIVGKEDVLTGSQLIGQIQGGVVKITKYDNNFPSTNGGFVRMHGFYEIS